MIKLGGPVHALAPEGVGWRKELALRTEQFNNRTLNEVHEAIQDYIYEKATEGATFKQCANEFGVDPADFILYRSVWSLGRNHLQMKIQKRTLEFGLTSAHPVGLIWLGKSMGGLSETPQEEENAEPADVTINVQVIRAKREGTGELLADHTSTSVASTRLEAGEESYD